MVPPVGHRAHAGHARLLRQRPRGAPRQLRVAHFRHRPRVNFRARRRHLEGAQLEGFHSRRHVGATAHAGASGRAPHLRRPGGRRLDGRFGRRHRPGRPHRHCLGDCQAGGLLQARVVRQVQSLPGGDLLAENAGRPHSLRPRLAAGRGVAQGRQRPDDQQVLLPAGRGVPHGRAGGLQVL